MTKKNNNCNKTNITNNKNPNEIINFYDIIPKRFLIDVDNPNKHIHNIDIPFRMCVVAPSGSGKTNFLMNLIKVFSIGKGTFSDITIITRNADEPLYNWLSSVDDNIRIKEGMIHNPKLDDYDKDSNHLLIWDDLMLSKNIKEVEDYYIRARKMNVSLAFLSQSYSAIPPVIRKNSSELVLLDLSGSSRDRNFILKEWSGDIQKEILIKIYNDSTSKNLQPLIIKGGKTNKNKKYSNGFNNYYNVDEIMNEENNEENNAEDKPKRKYKKKLLGS